MTSSVEIIQVGDRQKVDLLGILIYNEKLKIRVWRGTPFFELNAELKETKL